MKRLILIASILVAGIASADNLLRYGKYEGPEYTITLFAESIGCGKDRMSASATWPGLRGRLKVGCWEPRGDLIHIEYIDGDGQEVVPHSAFTLDPRFRKPRWWL